MVRGGKTYCSSQVTVAQPMTPSTSVYTQVSDSRPTARQANAGLTCIATLLVLLHAPLNRVLAYARVCLSALSTAITGHMQVTQ